MLDRLLAQAPSLQRAASIPVHAQIEQWLCSLIDNGEVMPGDKMPREAELATGLGVSRMTLRQSLGSLEKRGVVERIPGRNGGTFIVEPKIEVDITGLAGFTEQLRRGRVRASARVVSATTAPPSRAVLNALELSRESLVHEVIRVRLAHGEPLALECSYLPASVFPGLLDHRLTGSLYSLLRRQYGQVPHTATESLEPLIAAATEGRLLQVEPGSALTLIERTAYSAAGVPIEFARDLFRPDRIRITVRTATAASH